MPAMDWYAPVAQRLLVVERLAQSPSLSKKVVNMAQRRGRRTSLDYTEDLSASIGNFHGNGQ
jgi:hypothetical protein